MAAIETTVPKANEEQNPVVRESTREEERYIAPPVDIYETEDGLTVLADLPGVSRENLHIAVEGDVLTLEGKVAPELKGDLIWKEFELVNFWRQFQLSDAVDQEKISAELNGGVLKLHLPKAEKAKPKRIQVKVA